jgi:peptidoglycan/LPS O-acetylase OafA/YrhL
MKISDFTCGRDNNFNLIRIIAAYAVLVSHSFSLATGRGDTEPFRDTLGMTLGSIAVDIFFVTSGFLVTASLLTRQSTIEFVWARVLRVFPALLLMLLLTVFVLGPFFTTLPWSSYFTDPKLYKYFLKSLTLITGVEFNLPGVFENNPYKNAVNGSLWTMPSEVRLYAILAVIWVLLSAIPRFGSTVFGFTITLGAILAGVLVICGHFNLIESNPRLPFMFFTGSAFFVLKERVVLSHVAFSILTVALLLASSNPSIFFIVYTAALAYILFYIAYVPSGIIRKYNKLGDYSYGVYIYAFPVQQSTAALFPGISVLYMVIISTVVTLVFSVLSWHSIERHALKLRGHFVNHSRRLLSFGAAGASTTR